MASKSQAPTPKKKAKKEVFHSKSEMKRHEKYESNTMVAMEKKMGEKDAVKKGKLKKKAN